MSTYFLRTVPESSGVGASNRSRLETTVNNTGNYFFEAAVSRQLDAYRPILDLNALPSDVDTLILSMSNFISPATDLGWFADLIEARNIPRIVMIGAGAQAESFSHPVELTEGTRRFVSVLSHRSESIGVRGYFTAEILGKLGVRNVDVIGCPSLFFNNDRDFQINRRNLEGRRPRTVTHCTPYGNFRDAVGHLLSFAVRECEGYVAQSETALLFDEESSDRRRYFFYYYNDGDYSESDLEAWMRQHVRWFFDLESWFGYMSQMDFSVGARFHGNMAALQVGVPALNLVCDSRTRELCEYLNLPFVFLKDFDGRRSAAQLYEETDFSLFNASYSFKYDRYRNFLERNGLKHKLSPQSDAIPRSAVGEAQVESVAALLRSVNALDLSRAALARELMLRLESDRDHATMKLAESGAFDLRNTLGSAEGGEA